MRRDYLHFVKKYQRLYTITIHTCSMCLLSLCTLMLRLCYSFFLFLGMRRGIPTSLLMSHRASVLRKEIMLPLDNAGYDSIQMNENVSLLILIFCCSLFDLLFCFIGDFRPLSKTVRFNVVKVIPAGSSSTFGKKAFTGM